MRARLSLVVAAVGGALLMTVFQLGWQAWAKGSKKKAKPVVIEQEVPAPPELMAPDSMVPGGWQALDFSQTIPIGWGSVISINRVEKGGESYTFWFLGTDGTLRGITTRKFTGPNRGSFFPEVYVIRRR